ncbi:hypothetical protein SDC9_188934 [bioreactor metagenome]|uniref:Uncharacterized protein n=1 Tax=bioreactor metagenome TaxID=1076179 RepID=A0A645HQQ4_9ZZZZ
MSFSVRRTSFPPPRMKKRWTLRWMPIPWKFIFSTRSMTVLPDSGKECRSAIPAPVKSVSRLLSSTIPPSVPGNGATAISTADRKASPSRSVSHAKETRIFSAVTIRKWRRAGFSEPRFRECCAFSCCIPTGATAASVTT